MWRQAVCQSNVSSVIVSMCLGSGSRRSCFSLWEHKWRKRSVESVDTLGLDLAASLP